MNCHSLYIGTMRFVTKRNWVQDLYGVQRVMFLGLQETRMTQVDLFMVKGA